MTRQIGLGRGLDALIPSSARFGETPAPVDPRFITVPPADLRPNPRQPRREFDEPALHELAASLRHVGMLQPIIVRRGQDGRYEIVAGERRYRAALLADLDRVPVIVRETQDDALLTEALVENLHRTDLNPLEEAAAYRQLLDDLGLTHEELATRIGKSRSAISNTLRLLSLAPPVQERLVSGALSTGHARALLALDDPAQQVRACQRVIADGLSVRATEELVRKLATGPDALRDLAEAARRRASSPYEGLQRRLTDVLATKVRISGTERRGRVVIDYSGREDLERVLSILGRGTGEDLLRED